jgi:hypothetical protein
MHGPKHIKFTSKQNTDKFEHSTTYCLFVLVKARVKIYRPSHLPGEIFSETEENMFSVTRF